MSYVGSGVDSEYVLQEKHEAVVERAPSWTPLSSYFLFLKVLIKCTWLQVKY
jgi:hypothetical protein